MPYFQFPRRPASAARKLLLIKAILSLVSYSLDKAFHLLPGFQAKLFLTRDCVCDFYCWRRQNDDEMSRCHHEKVKHALQLAEKGDVKSIQKLQQHATRSTSPSILPTYHRLDTRAELSCSSSFCYESKQWMFYLSLCAGADRGKSDNLLKLYHKTLYEGKYEVWYISSREFFFKYKNRYFAHAFYNFPP